MDKIWINLRENCGKKDMDGTLEFGFTEKKIRLTRTSSCHYDLASTEFRTEDSTMCCVCEIKFCVSYNRRNIVL